MVCRILRDSRWPALSLTGYLNMGYCNRTLDEEGDRDGHCHGSDDESTYYWWVRDHWFRQYNGRLRCCCNWRDVKTGWLVNHCDYRRKVPRRGRYTSRNCRDANEEHNKGFDSGCNRRAKENRNVVRNSPISYDIANPQCWEVQKFGHRDNYDG